MDKLLEHAAQRLAQAGCDSPKREARLLWESVQNMMIGPPTEQGEARSMGVTGGKSPLETFNSLLARRIAREPLAQILGSKAVWSLDFYVNRYTLTPRPDSETVVEAALAILAKNKDGSKKLSPYRLLDLGTGSGCLLLSLLHELPNATGLGVDSSENALAVAAQNAQHLQLAARASFIQGNWAQGLNDTFDMVISNPPYIPRADMASLMPEVRDYEPHSALFGGEDGLDDYRLILADMPRLLKTGGHAVLELGINQAVDVRRIGEEAGLKYQNTRHDLGAIERVIIFTNH